MHDKLHRSNGPFGPVFEHEDYPFKVQLREDLCSTRPDDALFAARNDYSDTTPIDKSMFDAMNGTEKTEQELINDLIRKGHFGPAEHCTGYFSLEGISVVAERQITRHRHMSFDVQSMRYVNYEDKDMFDYVMSITSDTPASDKAVEMYVKCIQNCISTYRGLVSDEQEVAPELARYILPLATPVNVVMSANARSLMHLLDLRISGAAQSETAAIALAVRAAAREFAPKTMQAYEQFTNHNALRAP